MIGVNIRKIVMDNEEYKALERCATILGAIYADFQQVVRDNELDEIDEVYDVMLDFENVCDDLSSLIPDIEGCEYIDIQRE